MQQDDNVFLQSGTTLPAKNSRYAVLAAVFGAGTLAVMIVSSVLFGLGFERVGYYLAFLYLLFPAAIVFGHIAKRKIDAAPNRIKGRSLALLGLGLGYFNLIVTAMIVYFMFARAG